MKNRKSFILLFLLVAFAFVGIGYAALIDGFKIDGTVASDPLDEADTDTAWDDFVVKFGDADPVVTVNFDDNGKAPTDHVDVTAARTGDTSATVTIAKGFTRIGDYVDVKFTIENASPAEDLKANLTTPVIETSEDDKDAAAKIYVVELQTALSATTIAPGENATFTIRVYVAHTQVEPTSDLTFTVTFTATAEVDTTKPYK